MQTQLAEQLTQDFKTAPRNEIGRQWRTVVYMDGTFGLEYQEESFTTEGSFYWNTVWEQGGDSVKRFQNEAEIAEYVKAHSVIKYIPVVFNKSSTEA